MKRILLAAALAAVTTSAHADDTWWRFVEDDSKVFCAAVSTQTGTTPWADWTSARADDHGSEIDVHVTMTIPVNTGAGAPFLFTTRFFHTKQDCVAAAR